MNNRTYTKGTIQYSNGNFYDGEFINHKPHGKGTMQFADGMIFFGNWQYGLPVNEDSIIILTNGSIIEDSIHNYQTSFLSNIATKLKLVTIKPTEEQLQLEINKANYCPYSFREPVLQMSNLASTHYNNLSNPTLATQSTFAHSQDSIKNKKEERKSPTR